MIARQMVPGQVTIQEQAGDYLISVSLDSSHQDPHFMWRGGLKVFESFAGGTGAPGIDVTSEVFGSEFAPQACISTMGQARDWALRQLERSLGQADKP